MTEQPTTAPSSIAALVAALRAPSFQQDSAWHNPNGSYATKPRDLIDAAADLVEGLTDALQGLLDNHCQLVSCGDCGSWDVEYEPEVIKARSFLPAVSP